MTITRKVAEAELVQRASRKMQLVGMTVTVEGSNADLNSPLSVALHKMGYEASATVSDADLALVETDDIDELYDRAELRLLENILGNLDLTDIRIGQTSESLGQHAEQLQKSIEALAKRLKDEYGAGVSQLTAGTLMLDFQETDEDDN